MKAAILACLLTVTLPAIGLAQNVLDGRPSLVTTGDLPANTSWSDAGVIDIVGSTSNTATGTGLAKGNSYRVDNTVVLNLAEFWLNYTGSQTLTYYVFQSPVEFGTYTEVFRDSETVAGTGPGWYASSPINVALNAGNHYIVAVSWSGTLTYFFGTGDSQATSFGAHVHGYATGVHPLPAQFNSLVNDGAIYHQRLTTDLATPVEGSTWGGIKSLYR